MSTKIGQVRIRTDTDDPLAARMRGDAALRSLDLEPPGMPARMILCIRSMADPLPGGLDLRSAHAPRATEWERAARTAIGDALHRAVRIIDGPVPATADAVLFADRAELLACAARDAAPSEGGWWWRDVIRGGLTWTHVIREWTRAPQYVPAALELLVRSGAAVAFVRALDAQQAIELLTNVLRAHALEPLALVIVQALAAQHAPSEPGRPSSAIPALLCDVVPELVSVTVPSVLTLEQSVFAAITLALRRAPASVRTAQFVHEITAWIAPPLPVVAAKPALDARSLERHGRPHLPEETNTPARSRDAAQQPETLTKRISEAAPSHPEVLGSETKPEYPSDFTPPPPAVRADPESDGLEPEQRSIRNPQTATPLQNAIEITPDTIDSDHAGLFFLLNIAIALGFYDPYGREEPIALDVWDFLALTGRALVPDVEKDDLWPLLAQLANREEDDLPELDEEILNHVRDALSLVVEHEDAASFVIKRPGRIALSPAHIDVTFCLAAHPIEIRVAGLDRDPGWIPAAGRHVDFHFD